MVYSADVTPVAQLAEAAPIAPPRPSRPRSLGAMLLSPGATGAVSDAGREIGEPR